MKQVQNHINGFTQYVHREKEKEAVPGLLSKYGVSLTATLLLTSRRLVELQALTTQPLYILHSLRTNSRLGLLSHQHGLLQQLPAI